MDKKKRGNRKGGNRLEGGEMWRKKGRKNERGKKRSESQSLSSSF
jgi:hypothetical protein